MSIVSTPKFATFGSCSLKRPPDEGKVVSVVSLITFQFGEQVFGSGKAPKQEYSVLYNYFGNEARDKKMPPKWKVINDTMLKAK